ncbi:hypothetical protein BXZ70DRAFT_1002954 [Cristinia sonorae]|uniref:Uncharacterized protein n=2 Tax=Cristinia sonorae TaxID=1940300 RepID=A0A8K0UCZ8_9AGAR|nr:hypothetical protein BXZ70DRAFT_1002954 [Cristinia sonorae]
MRQRSQTINDLQLLESRITTVKPKFKNCERDVINDIKAEMFAKDTGQKLHTFYSSKRGRKKKNKILWKLKPEHTKNLPSKLTYNIATECGVVVGWKARNIGHDKQALDTLFIRLTALPAPIQLEGLPENVVPITASQYPVPCTAANEEEIRINRSQVYVLPNFAMTDYNSQGRTRPYNVMDLNNCRSHQSIYTCLSRGSTYDGTLIIQGFSTTHLQKGLNGELKREFRDLEMLDEITKLRFHETLPKNVYGESRNALIYSYRAVVGEKHVPAAIHEQLAWNAEHKYVVDEVTDENMFNYEYIDGKNKTSSDKSKPRAPSRKKQVTVQNKADMTKYVPAKGSQPLKAVNIAAPKSDPETSMPVAAKSKRKFEEDLELSEHTKRPRLETSDIANHDLVPIGFKWSNQSCAYDSLFTILYHVYVTSPEVWATYVSPQNNYLRLFEDLCKEVQGGDMSMEKMRAQLRTVLNKSNFEYFPLNHVGTSIDELCAEFLRMPSEYLLCKRGCKKQVYQSSWLGFPQDWIKVASCHKIEQKCGMCSRKIFRRLIFSEEMPMFVFVNVSPVEVLVTPSLIYLGSEHFVCRVIDAQGKVWYNDGIETGRLCIEEGNFVNADSTYFLKAKGKRLSTVIYMKQ